MLEEKIEDLKNKGDPEAALDTPKSQIPVKIDIMISAGIPDSYFMNETDKINFYREIESISDYSDLESIRDSLFENMDESHESSVHNLFLLLELQLLCREKRIVSIKKI